MTTMGAFEPFISGDLTIRLPASSDEAEEAQALSLMPPAIKGYLRLGGLVGEGVVIDRQFNSTDICIVVKTDLMTGRYGRHYALANHIHSKTSLYGTTKNAIGKA